MGYESINYLVHCDLVVNYISIVETGSGQHSILTHCLIIVVTRALMNVTKCCFLGVATHFTINGPAHAKRQIVARSCMCRMIRSDLETNGNF